MPTTQAIVIKAYQAQYLDPISFQAGESIQVGQEDTEFPGWVWCTDQRGKSGWMPKHTFEAEGQSGQTVMDYTARELTAHEGQTLIVHKIEFGWAWCTNSDEASGWIPESCLEFSPA